MLARVPRTHERDVSRWWMPASGVATPNSNLLQNVIFCSGRSQTARGWRWMACLCVCGADGAPVNVGRGSNCASWNLKNAGKEIEQCWTWSLFREVNYWKNSNNNTKRSDVIFERAGHFSGIVNSSVRSNNS